MDDLRRRTMVMTTSNSITTPNVLASHISTVNKILNDEYKYSGKLPFINPDVYIKEVVYSDPATIIFWSDNTKTVCKCRYPDTYSKETGLTLCVLKKIFGGTKLKHLMEDWIPDQESFTTQRVTLRDVIKKNK